MIILPKLKHCPFCSGKAELEHSYHEDNDRTPRDFWHVRAICTSCGATPTGWVQYGCQEQKIVEPHVKMVAELKVSNMWNMRSIDADCQKTQFDAPFK